MSAANNLGQYWIDSNAEIASNAADDVTSYAYPNKNRVDLFMELNYSPHPKKNKYGNNTKHINKLLKKMGR